MRTLEEQRERLNQLHEERRRNYAALVLKASITVMDASRSPGTPPVAFCPAEETRQLVERIIYDPERVKWRQEWRARVERLLSKDGTQRKGGVMSCDGSS